MCVQCGGTRRTTKRHAPTDRVMSTSAAKVRGLKPPPNTIRTSVMHDVICDDDDKDDDDDNDDDDGDGGDGETSASNRSGASHAPSHKPSSAGGMVHVSDALLSRNPSRPLPRIS